MRKAAFQKKPWKAGAVLLALGTVVFISANLLPNPSAETMAALKYDEGAGMTEVLLALGDKKPLHYTDKRDAELVQRGLDLITKGRAIGPDGKMGSRQSKHFVCTNCHNVGREDPNLAVSDPDARLQYVIDNDMKFLQGTTLWGIVNRESWYNDDYVRKYGDLVRPSRDTLDNAIYLCCVECSQGRPFVDWELEAVYAYLYSIEVTLGDIGLKPEQYVELDRILNSGTEKEKQDAINWFKTQYMVKSPATYAYPPSPEHRKKGDGGNPERGELIYQASCQTCHNNEGVTHFILDDKKMTFNLLKNYMGKEHKYSTYDMVRKGTYALHGYRPYMPFYTKERMSDQQLEDLNAYILQQSK